MLIEFLIAISLLGYITRSVKVYQRMPHGTLTCDANSVPIGRLTRANVAHLDETADKLERLVGDYQSPTITDISTDQNLDSNYVSLRNEFPEISNFEWISAARDTIDSIHNSLERIGIEIPESAPGDDGRSSIEQATDTLTQLTSRQRRICGSTFCSAAVIAAETVATIIAMNTRVLAGGYKATQALRELHRVMNHQYSRRAMKSTSFACTLLARKEPTSDYQRGLALSLRATLEGIASLVEVNDPQTGGFAHVNM